MGTRKSVLHGEMPRAIREVKARLILAFQEKTNQERRFEVLDKEMSVITEEIRDGHRNPNAIEDVNTFLDALLQDVRGLMNS